MVDIHLIKKIPNLFKRALNTLSDNESNSEITKDYIQNISGDVLSNLCGMNVIQKAILSKIMQYLIIFYDNNAQYKSFEDLEQDYIDIFDKNITKLAKDKIFEGKENLEDKNLEDIILIIIKYFLNELKGKQNPKDLKKKWESLGLNLENFEINKVIGEKLKSYLEESKQVKYRKELDKVLISELNSESYTEILRNIKYFLDFKGEEKCSIVTLKDIADREREEEYLEYEEEEDKNKNKLDIAKSMHNVPKDYLTNVFKKWIIEITDLEHPDPPNIKFVDEKNIEITDDFYNEYKYVGKTYEKKFKGYIEFKNKIMKYINQEINNIKLKITIRLEITPVKDEKEIYDDERYYYFEEIKCRSSYIYKKKKYEYIDNNILVDGIKGKSPGFIFLINELCNDDYESTEKEE